MIATRRIEDGYTLLHSDPDFEPFVAHLGLRSVFQGQRFAGFVWLMSLRRIHG